MTKEEMMQVETASELFHLIKAYPEIADKGVTDRFQGLRVAEFRKKYPNPNIHYDLF